MNFVLLDDVAAHNDILSTKLTNLCCKHNWDGHIALKATTLQEVVSYAMSNPEPTVYFFDIRLSENEDTLSLFRQIQRQHTESYLIYISAHPQYAMECLHTHAFDFLLKPLMDEQLEDCMTALWRVHQNKTDDDLLPISMGGRMLMLPQGQIIYLSRDRMNVHCYCADGSSYVWRESFEHLLPRLNPACFVQCHRSYIVNVRCISEVRWDEDKLVLNTAQELPISRRRSSSLRLLLKTQEGKKWNTR